MSLYALCLLRCLGCCLPPHTRYLSAPIQIHLQHTCAAHSPSGTCWRSSSSQTTAVASLGARQSPRGESDPPEPTFGPFGTAERLNWLSWKKRNRKTSSQRLIVASVYSLR